MSFNIGDVVVLKSGGPAMTITHVSNEGRVSCAWFEKTTADYKYVKFAAELLKLVNAA